MSSESVRAFVWTWLPERAEPVVAGALDGDGETITFTYGRSYLDRSDAVPLYLPELPLVTGAQRPDAGELAGCIADAGPDGWGMRVILNRLIGRKAVDVDQLTTLTYLLESDSDRIGAVDFQASADIYVPRGVGTATLDHLAEAADLVQKGVELPPALSDALLHGSSIGGARPKALLEDGQRQLIAKFELDERLLPGRKG